MEIQIPEKGIIKEQKFDIEKDVSIIYGYNNSGKTTILKVINEVFYSELMRGFIFNEKKDTSVYIPTNRIIVENIMTKDMNFNDVEELVNYQNYMIDNYNSHLGNIRRYLLKNEIILDFVCKIIKQIFEIEINNINERYSDGIENIINIYLSIIWIMIWDVDIEALNKKEFYKIIEEKKIYVLIDEIEMFLHVNIQSKLIDSLKEHFINCNFIFTTHSPLFLTRYKNSVVYNIDDGMLNYVDEELYYQDLDTVYEVLFGVQELPQQMREDINCLGKVIMEGKLISKDEINNIARRIEKEYPNLYDRYSVIITKALHKGEENDKNQKRK